MTSFFLCFIYDCVVKFFAQIVFFWWKNSGISTIYIMYMAGIDENIVREYFEINGFLVRQFYKYQVQSRKKRADEEIDLVVYNPNCSDAGQNDIGFVLSAQDISKIRQAVVSVKGWHTSTFSAAILNSSDEIFKFLQKNALKRVESMFQQGGKVFKILAIPSLPKNRSERQKSVNLLKSKGVDGILTYPHMLRNIADSIEVNNNYVKSDLLQTIRILKNYYMLRLPQMELFDR